MKLRRDGISLLPSILAPRTATGHRRNWPTFFALTDHIKSQYLSVIKITQPTGSVPCSQGSKGGVASVEIACTIRPTMDRYDPLSVGDGSPRPFLPTHASSAFPPSTRPIYSAVTASCLAALFRPPTWTQSAAGLRAPCPSPREAIAFLSPGVLSGRQ